MPTLLGGTLATPPDPGGNATLSPEPTALASPEATVAVSPAAAPSSSQPPKLGVDGDMTILIVLASLVVAGIAIAVAVGYVRHRRKAAARRAAELEFRAAGERDATQFTGGRIMGQTAPADSPFTASGLTFGLGPVEDEYASSDDG
jgi:hypothetical protein